MKRITFILLAISLVSCKKEINSGNPKREEIAIAQQKLIAEKNIIDPHIVSDVTVGNKRTYAYQNKTVAEFVPDKTIPNQWNVLIKDSTNIPLVYKETDYGTYVHCLFQSDKGLVYFYADIRKADNFILNVVSVNDVPIRLIKNCFTNAVHLCLNNKLCFMQCTFGGWGGCMLGWYVGCKYVNS